MKRIYRIVTISIGIILVGVAAEEYFARKQMETRYQTAIERQQSLETRVNEVLGSHEMLKAELVKEQYDSQKLVQAIAEKSIQLEAVTVKLSEESRIAKQLHAQLTTMQSQMDELQAELSMVIEEQPQIHAMSGSETVELERIIISEDGLSSMEGRVVSIHPEWSFVIVDLGWDEVKIGDTISIVRDTDLLAKARIERVREGVCAASVLPNWQIDGIEVDDVVIPL